MNVYSKAKTVLGGDCLRLHRFRIQAAAVLIQGLGLELVLLSFKVMSPEDIYLHRYTLYWV